MRDNWQNLIPFYVANTLSDTEKRAFEAYLEQCGIPCQQAVEEWRTIGSATWQHINTNIAGLPPLSQDVLNEVKKDAPIRKSKKVVTPQQFNGDSMVSQAPVYPITASYPNRPSRQTRNLPLTMVAAVLTVFIFGGILLSQLTPNDLEPGAGIVALPTEADVTIEPTEQFGGPAGIEPVNPNGSGIIATPTSHAPQASATFTPSVMPSRTPIPPTQAAINLDATLMTGLPFGSCGIRNDTQGALTIYRNASFDAEVAGIFRMNAESPIRIIFEDWYELSYGHWVNGASVTVFGECSQVVTATPTAIGDTTGGGGTVDDGIPNCVVHNDSSETIPLYQWATNDSPINGQLSPGESKNIYVGANGWYQVFYAQWVNGAEVTLIGLGCDQLWIPTPTFFPNTTPTPVPTATNEVIFTPTVPFVPSVTPFIENWSHVTTVVEHGCGGTVGEQATIATQLQYLENGIQLTYPETLTTVLLGRIAPNSYAGAYGREATVQVDLNITSPTTYTANETVTHTSGCIVRLTWEGTRQ